MKNSFKIALLATAVFVAAESTTYAQEKKPVTKEIGEAAKDVGKATATGAKAVGKKTSEVASKGAAAVSTKRYKGHWALTGELVYIDEYGKYFYVDKKGHRVFITKAQMRTTKP
jgi:acyl-CoA synthetase (AMP-forming)/AMP-acid ligase II